MIKQSIILIFTILLFTACVERGHFLHPASKRIIQKEEPIPSIRKKNVNKNSKSEKTKVLKEIKKTHPKKIEKKSNTEIPFLDFLETKNKTLSALAIVAISIIILL